MTVYSLVTVRAAAEHTAAAAGAAGATTGPADALEAVAAVDWTVAAGLEGHLGGLTAAAADDVEELALGTGGAGEAAAAAIAFALVAAHGAAGAAALGLGEAARRVELLVLGAERELLATVRTG